jgi:hypothetical protein
LEEVVFFIIVENSELFKEFASELSKEELAIVKQSYFELFEGFVAVFTKG